MFSRYFVYVIECRGFGKNNHGMSIFYTGFTKRPKRRMHEHKVSFHSNFMQRYKYFPVKLVFLKSIDNYYEGLKEEKRIKRLKRWEKENLIKKFQMSIGIIDKNIVDIQSKLWGHNIFMECG